MQFLWFIARKIKAASRATDDFSHINTFNQIKKYEKNYNLNKSLSLIKQANISHKYPLVKFLTKN